MQSFGLAASLSLSFQAELSEFAFSGLLGLKREQERLVANPSKV